jgi:GWxTD domain-containing protein
MIPAMMNDRPRRDALGVFLCALPVASLSLFFILAGLARPSCAADQKKADSTKGFYDKVRLIMTDDEARVFKGLPNEISRTEFMDEFWAIRDPDPYTPENEAKIEFEKRARYASLWFGTSNPYNGRDPGGPVEYAGAWSDERGRVYLLLGKPDLITFFDGHHETTSIDGTRPRMHADRWVLEQWVYDHLHTYVIFRRSGSARVYDGSRPDLPDSGQDELDSQKSVLEEVNYHGSWFLDSFHSNFLDLLEWAKLNSFSSSEQGEVTSWFRFSAAWGTKGLQVTIPVDRVSTDDRFKVSLGIQVNVYCDNLKIGEIRDTRELTESKDNLFEGKNIRFEIPYAPERKGNYLFDIIIRDLMAPAASRYRVLIKHSF